MSDSSRYIPPLSTIPLSGNLHPHRRTWFTPYAVTIEILTTVLLGIRLGSRISKLGGRPGLDDILITFGWLVGLGLTIVSIYGLFFLFHMPSIADWVAITFWGFELDMQDVPPDLWWHGAVVCSRRPVSSVADGSSLRSWLSTSTCTPQHARSCRS
jgi:hypothetical protein